jgi:LruC domain-containing protein
VKVNHLNKIFYTQLILFVLITTHCKRSVSNQDVIDETKPNTPINPVTSIKDVKPPANFNFNTVAAKTIIVKVLGTNNAPLPFVSVLLMDNAIENNGNIIAKAITNNNGDAAFNIELPTYYKRLVLNSSYKGVPKDLILNLNQSPIQQIEIGGNKPNPYQTVEIGSNFSVGSLQKNITRFSGKLGSWNDTSGLPDYLISPNDVVPNQLLTDISNVLPERVAVPGRRDDLLDDASTLRLIKIIDTCEVFVTFLFEGASFKNTLFYYTYPTNNPPASVNDIDSFYVIFPNASFNNSGGQLQTGNKVKIGNFRAGTTIAYGIVANGWRGGNSGFRGITNGNGLYYANKNFNPESNPNLKQHMILLNDQVNNRLVMGFEDLRRDAGGCDHDFNDVVFYTTVNPISAVDLTGIPPLTPAKDSDGDGVPDEDDDYPNDNQRAANNYYPNANTFATVAFEDLWPYKGDYDLNDVVVDFNYKIVTDAQNRVKDVIAKYVLRASGGFLENAFAVEFPTNRSNVTSVSGATLDAESNNAVIKIFDNMRTEMQGWNTIPGVAYVDTVIYNVSFSLINPVPVNAFGIGLYNPFIWAKNDGRNRGYEIHLPGKNYTNLANTSLFGTADDNTQTNSTNTYKSKDNLFWAISIPERFEYPKEQQDITGVYLRFGQWANSGGVQFTDWYRKLEGYRNEEKIYQKP